MFLYGVLQNSNKSKRSRSLGLGNEVWKRFGYWVLGLRTSCDYDLQSGGVLQLPTSQFVYTPVMLIALLGGLGPQGRRWCEAGDCPSLCRAGVLLFGKYCTKYFADVVLVGLH